MQTNPPIDPRFPAALPNRPFDMRRYVPLNGKTGDLIHAFYQEQMQINDGAMNRFAQVSNAAGLAMGYYDTNGTYLWKLAREFAMGDAMAEILRIAPGAAAPRHTHSGDEYTLVLTGAFHDDAGLYRAGDIAIADPGVTHRPTAEPGAVCYSFAVTDGPLKFTGAMGLLTTLWRN